MSALNYGLGTDKSPDALWFYFSSCTREPGSWKEELYAAARAIAHTAQKPIWVCSSGGIGSEVVCRAFYDQGINFSVLTIEHKAGTNLHDIGYAKEWCRARGVHQKIVAVDMQVFLTTDVDAYAKQYVAIHPFRYFQIKLMEIVEDMGGYAILGGSEHAYITDRTRSTLTREDIFLLFSIGNTAPPHWCRDNQAAHEYSFHYSTPELCLSYLRLPLVSYALDNPETVFRHKDNVYGLKRLVYQSVWTDMEVRSRYSGFEHIVPLVTSAMERMRQTFGEKQQTYQMPVTEFEKQLTGASAKEHLTVS